MIAYPQIDAVIAWVDGSDPAHFRKRMAAMGKASGPVAGTEETRFSDLGEIYYCVASILKFAPFIRRIHIITDDQIPGDIGAFSAQGLCAPDKIRIVDHREIFRGHEDCLPTFNSLSIETMMGNIDGLADTILYFNDDFFLNAPLSPADILNPENKIRLQAKIKPIKPQLLKHHLQKLRRRLTGRIVPAHYKLAQARAAMLLGQRHYQQLPHIPHVIRPKVLEDYFAIHPQVLRAQISHRFRNHTQFLPVALANQLELVAGTAEFIQRRPPVYLKSDRSIPDFTAQVAPNDSLFGCIQSLDEFSPQKRAAVRAGMAARLGSHLPAGISALESEPADDPAAAHWLKAPYAGSFAKRK